VVGGKFLQPPTAVSPGAVVMSAPPATDDGGQVLYRFESTDSQGRTSGWISTNRWTDCGVEPGKTCTYVFSVRDRAGNTTPPSEAAAVKVPVPAPAEVDFAEAPRGLDGKRIRMTASRAPETTGTVEYRFERTDGGAASGWQASRTWTDAAVEEGATYSYTVQARNAAGRTSRKSAPRTAAARDETPPARFRLGEWATLPLATIDKALFMRARNVTGQDGEPRIEEGRVEYRFTCSRGGGPDSGWQERSDWRTPSLPDGEYVYRFRMRDSAGNETPDSSEEKAVVSARTGYHAFPAARIASLEDDTLVEVRGKVAAVEPAAYLIESDGTRVRVTPRTPGSRTDGALQGRAVTVKGCIRTLDGEKRITWAEID